MSRDWDALVTHAAGTGFSLRCPVCDSDSLREDTSMMISRNDPWLLVLCDACGNTQLHRRDVLRRLG
jgi:NAD-dependent SIR2 family protein deacetylase